MSHGWAVRVGYVILIVLALAAREVAAQSSDAGLPDAALPDAEPAPAPPTEAAPEPVPPPTAAEPPAPPEPEVAPPAPTDSEMVVTAQRYEQDPQKTPVTVSALSTRAMEQRGVSNLQDVARFAPNLQLQATNRPAGGGSAYAAYIRGIGTGDFQFPTDPGVGLYVDDVYIARTIGGLLSTDTDIERIEVIKGPQGTLFGRNTIGGAINVVSAKPQLSGPVTGSALLRLGAYGRKDFAVSANGPLLADRLAGKLSVASLHSDGYGKRILDGQKTNGEERLTLRGGLLWKLTDALELRVDGDYSRQDQSPPTGVMLRYAPSDMTAMKIARYNMLAAPALNPGLRLPQGSVFDARWVIPGDHDTYALQPMYDRYDLGGGSARVTWSPSESFSLKSISAVRKVRSDVAVDGDQTPYPLQSSRTTLDDTQLSEELQLSGRVLAQRLQYLVGLYVFRERGSSHVDTESYHGLFESQQMPMIADAGDTATRFALTATSYAAFTQETLRILDGLNLTAGVRVNHDRKVYDYGVDFTQRGVAQVPASHATASWTSVTPKVGLDYSPIEPVMLYASYGHGFKSGGFSASNSPSNPTPVYDPERVTAYEVGVKTHWFERRRLTANLTGFLNDYRDIQLTVQSVDPVTNANVRTTQNAGGSKIKGFEADVVATPVTGLNLNFAVGYVDAKFDRLSTNALMSRFALGDRLPQIPDWTLSVGAQYTLDLRVGELTLRSDLSYRGEQFLTPADPSSRQGSYALWSARVAFVPQGLHELELAVYGLNLTDQRYYVYRATLAPTGQEAGIPGAPRLIFATARYAF